MRAARSFALCLSLCILILAGCSRPTDCAVSEGIYYIKSGQIYCSDDTVAVPWDECNGKILQIRRVEHTLCVSTALSDNQPAALYVYTPSSKTWTALSGVQPHHPRIQCWDGWIYYLSDPNGSISRVKADGTVQEALDITHRFSLGDFSLANDCVYTIDRTENGQRYRLGVFSISDRASRWLEIPVENGCQPRLSEGWLYQVPKDRAYGQIQIRRLELSELAGSAVHWAEPIVLDHSTLDYDRWGIERLQFYGDRILFETPKRELMLLQNGQTQKLWDIPAGSDSVDFEPLYFYSDSGIVTVYQASSPQHVKLSDWP